MRDRSITHRLQRWVSTKPSISQLECIFIFLIYPLVGSRTCGVFHFSRFYVVYFIVFSRFFTTFFVFSLLCVSVPSPPYPSVGTPTDVHAREGGRVLRLPRRPAATSGRCVGGHGGRGSRVRHQQRSLRDQVRFSLRSLYVLFCWLYSGLAMGLNRSPRWRNRLSSSLAWVSFVSSNPPACILVQIRGDFFLCTK